MIFCFKNARRVWAAPLALWLGLIWLVGCSTEQSHTAGPSETSSAAVSGNALFKDVAAGSGLTFKHDLGDSGHFYFDEFTASGCAFFDYDNDGYLDVFLVQSGSSESPATVRGRPFCALYHNNGNGTFTDVTAKSGFDKNLGYGQGVAVGDYDNDGFDDLFITAYNDNHLFHNKHGSGQFDDVTQSVGLGARHGEGYATSAAWGDYDGDGRLDLYVCYYARWNHALNKECRDPSGQLDYCQPQLYDPVTHRLFHNVKGRFVDVSDKSGISTAKGRGLAVAWTDFNEDGKMDIMVASDIAPNLLWRNNGHGTFTNVAAQAGSAYDGQGRTMSGMGIALADYNRSGRQSLYLSNFAGLPNILFKNVGGGVFEDTTDTANLGRSHLKFLSFGCEFLDYDADGWPDIISNNGHVQARQSKREAGVGWQQRKQLLHNEGNGRFKEIADAAQLGDLNTQVIGRGLATGDFDNDGRVDVLAMGQNAPVQLFHNQTGGNGNHFVSLLLRGTQSNRDAIGARVELEAGDVKQTDWVRGGSSYLSSSDRRLFFGLGKTDAVTRLSITWPSGKKETVSGVKPDCFVTLVEGQGIAKQTPAKTK